MPPRTPLWVCEMDGIVQECCAWPQTEVSPVSPAVHCDQSSSSFAHASRICARPARMGASFGHADGSPIANPDGRSPLASEVAALEIVQDDPAPLAFPAPSRMNADDRLP